MNFSFCRLAISAAQFLVVFCPFRICKNMPLFYIYSWLNLKKYNYKIAPQGGPWVTCAIFEKNSLHGMHKILMKKPAQVMLILILIDVQYLQNIVFSFEKGSNSQNHSSSDSHHLIKKSPQKNVTFSPTGENPPSHINYLERYGYWVWILGFILQTFLSFCSRIPNKV